MSSMCGVCKVLGVVYLPTQVGYQFWSPYDKTPYVYFVFVIMLYSKAVIGHLLGNIF